MISEEFQSLLTHELHRIDVSGTAKRHERIIEGFSRHHPPRAVINEKNYHIFNSNDYLGLRHHPEIKAAEHEASSHYGSGPGAVRFISGTLLVHHQLEKAIAAFHEREAAMIFSSAFATNMAVISSLVKGLNQDSLVTPDVIVISDKLNHRSIVDGIRVAGLPPEQKFIFEHKNPSDLGRILEENSGKYSRALVVTDGIFSMLGEYQNLSELQRVIHTYEDKYPQGIILIVDDAHGVGAFGDTGRGTAQTTNTMPDILVGTMGKAFGSDGGYVVADKIIIDYLRETCATYIYSNSIAPGTAGAGLAAISLMDTPAGRKLLDSSRENIDTFKSLMHQNGFTFAADSYHPIQAILIGDTQKTLRLTEGLFDKEILVTNINYPIVPRGADEIRVQISAAHTREDLEYFVSAITDIARPQ